MSWIPPSGYYGLSKGARSYVNQVFYKGGVISRAARWALVGGYEETMICRAVDLDGAESIAAALNLADPKGSLEPSSARRRVAEFLTGLLTEQATGPSAEEKT